MFVVFNGLIYFFLNRQIYLYDVVVFLCYPINCCGVYTIAIASLSFVILMICVFFELHQPCIIGLPILFFFPKEATFYGCICSFLCLQFIVSCVSFIIPYFELALGLFCSFSDFFFLVMLTYII